MSRTVRARKAAESERQRLNGILSSIGDGVYGIDIDSNITFINPAALELLGYSNGAELLGSSPATSVHPSKQTKTLHPLTAAYESSGGLQDITTNFVNREGTRVPVECSVHPLAIDGERVGSVVAFRNIKERQAMQHQLEWHMEELQRSNQELEQFAYVASHDLQEPLRMVTSFLQLLKRRYESQLDDDADEFINFAVDGAIRMQRLITDMLAYSRVTSKAQPLVPIHSEQALGEALENLQFSIEESGAAISHGALPQILGDASQISQLFQNLVSNAIKFRSDRPPSIEIAAEQSGDYWKFRVEDNGIGINKKYMERIFVIFQRLHTADEYTGTGIGLALCKKIVERHGGRIWLESAENEGSTFFFTLPRTAST